MALRTPATRRLAEVLHRRHHPADQPCNVAVTQSKRWPSFWDKLATNLPAWRSFCPPTSEVETFSAKLRADHVYKPTLGRVGDGVIMHANQPQSHYADSKDHARARRDLAFARIRRTLHMSSGWISQRRFNACGIEDSAGIERPLCLGVFVIDGKAAGIYGRLATDTWVHHSAKDIAVLVEHHRSADDATSPGAVNEIAGCRGHGSAWPRSATRSTHNTPHTCSHSIN